MKNRVRFKLTASGLDKLQGKYLATVLSNATNNLEQLGEQISLRRPAIDVAEVNLVMEALRNEVKRLLSLGYSISMPIGTFGPQIAGSVPSMDAPLDSQVNTIEPGFSVLPSTTAAMREIKPVNDTVTNGVKLFSIEDIATHEVGVIKGRTAFYVTGEGLSMSQQGENMAIVAADDSVLSEVTYDASGSQAPIYLKGTLASSVAAGTYRLRVQTRGYNNPSGELMTLMKKVTVTAS